GVLVDFDLYLEAVLAPDDLVLDVIRLAIVRRSDLVAGLAQFLRKGGDFPALEQGLEPILLVRPGLDPRPLAAGFAGNRGEWRRGDVCRILEHALGRPRPPDVLVHVEVPDLARRRIELDADFVRGPV